MDQRINRQQTGFGGNLIFVGVLSLLSIVFLYVADRYFTAGLYTSLLITVVGQVVGQGILFGIIAAIPCIVFILLGVMANKFDKLWPHVVGLIIYVLDTLVLLVDSALGDGLSSMILDIVFHGVFIFLIASSMRAYIKYKKAPQAGSYVYDTAYTISSDEPTDGETIEYINEEVQTSAEEELSEQAPDMLPEQEAAEENEPEGINEPSESIEEPGSEEKEQE